MMSLVFSNSRDKKPVPKSPQRPPSSQTLIIAKKGGVPGEGSSGRPSILHINVLTVSLLFRAWTGQTQCRPTEVGCQRSIGGWLSKSLG